MLVSGSHAHALPPTAERPAGRSLVIGRRFRLSPQHVQVRAQTADPQIQFLAIGPVTGAILQGVFIGDYTATAMGSDGVLHPCWTDFRGNPGVNGPNQDSYTQAIPLR